MAHGMKFFPSILICLALCLSVMAAESKSALAQSTSTCTPKTISVARAASDGGFSWYVTGSFGTTADTSRRPTQSILRVFENGVEMGPAHAAHADIRKLGKGRFSHWRVSRRTAGLYFSATDNTSVKTNGRTYTYCTGTTVSDTAAPSIPAGLTATVNSPSQITLAWSASTNNVGVTGYQVLRNGTVIATTNGLSYVDTGLSASTTYSYTIKAYDDARNFSATSATASATTSSSTSRGFPPDTIYDGPKSVPPLARPGYLQSVIDPAFGTKITRISDESMGLKAGYMQHDYSKDQPWNSDMTMIKLKGAVAILNANTYKMIQNTGHFRDEARWSTVDPNIIYYTQGPQFRKWNVVTGADTLIRSFSEGDVLMGPWEGNLSIGDRYVVLNAGTLAIVYDIVNNAIIAKKDLGSAAVDWVSISASGNYVVAASNAGGGVSVYDRNLNFLRKIFNISQHGGIGYNPGGNEVFAQMCPTQAARMDGTRVTDLIGGEKWWWCGHLSTRNYNRPGWAVLSTNGYDNGGDGGEIFALKLDDSFTVERFAHTRTTACSYDSQAKGVVSPDGKKVMWNSDWGRCGASSYAYVAEMP